MSGQRFLHLFLLVSAVGLLIWSAIEPFDRFTWVLEVFPAVIGGAVLATTYRRFKLTNLTYVLIWLHAIILIVGGKYTYARMPLFDWLKDTFELSRNYYDRLGHIAQGFVPAIITREVLLRTSPLKSGKWLFFLVICVCLAISAAYELFEWSAAVFTGTKADDFLATQGDIWDTQWDMFLALLGATASLLLLGRWHDNLLRRVVPDFPNG